MEPTLYGDGMQPVAESPAADLDDAPASTTYEGSARPGEPLCFPAESARPPRRTVRNVQLDAVAERLSESERLALVAALPPYLPRGLFARREAHEIVNRRRLLTTDAALVIELAILAAAEWCGRESARRCGTRDGGDVVRLCGSAWCPTCDPLIRRRWSARLKAQLAYDEALDRHWWFQTCAAVPAGGSAPVMAQIATRAAFTKYSRLLGRFGARDYASFLERSPPGHWHLHTLLRAPWLDAAAMERTGMSWPELAESARYLAERGGHDPLAGPLGWLRDAAVGCGMARNGFQLAPAFNPLALADYVTKEMLDESRTLISTVIGVKRVTYSPGFFDRPPDVDPGTVRRAQRDATKRNAPGGSDVGNG